MQSEPATADHSRLPGDSTADGAVTIPAPGMIGSPATGESVQSLDNHVLQEAVGHGGMGVVYRAWDPVLKRHVALKKIRSGVLADADEVERFYREARAAAQLQHPNVVPIHGMGLHQGEHCFTMALAPTTLEKQKKHYQSDVRGAVALVEAVARGVQAAHDKGIIHRDLKPANILLDDKNQPLVGDFGLAKSCDAGAGETLPGVVMGTAAYMAPEQAAGRTWEVGKRSDVWALGVILYELLTGRLPFQGAKASDILPQVLHSEPPRPRSLKPSVPGKLEVIVLRCLNKGPARRYASAATVADDLRRWLRNEPLQPSRTGRRSLRAAAVLLFLLGAFAVLLVPFFGRQGFTDQTNALPADERKYDPGQALARGQRVLLIGDHGTPRFQRWALRQGGVIRSPLGDDTFTLSAQQAALLELVPDGQRSYRFRAEVRHYDASKLGVVGLYFAHRRLATSQGFQHCFCTFTFSDVHALYSVPGQVGRFSRPSLQVWRHREAGHLDVPHDLKHWYFVPPRLARPAACDWRPLTVTVTPEFVEAVWDGNPKRVSTAGIREEFRKYNCRPGGVAECPDLNPSFGPRGGLGLYVSRSEVSFRRVAVEPLP